MATNPEELSTEQQKSVMDFIAGRNLNLSALPVSQGGNGSSGGSGNKITIKKAWVNTWWGKIIRVPVFILAVPALFLWDAIKNPVKRATRFLFGDW